MRKVICIIMLLVLPLTAAQADSGIVFGAGGALHNFDGSNDAVNPVNVFFRVALAVSETFEVGAEISTTLADDNLNGAEFDIDTNFVFIKANMRLSNGIVLYGLLGRSSIEVTERRSNFNRYIDDSGVGYGFGMQFGRGDRAAYTIDYISYYDDDEFDGVSADTTHGSLNLGYLSYF